MWCSLLFLCPFSLFEEVSCFFNIIIMWCPLLFCVNIIIMWCPLLFCVNIIIMWCPLLFCVNIIIMWCPLLFFDPPLIILRKCLALSIFATKEWLFRDIGWRVLFKDDAFLNFSSTHHCPHPASTHGYIMWSIWQRWRKLHVQTTRQPSTDPRRGQCGWKHGLETCHYNSQSQLRWVSFKVPHPSGLKCVSFWLHGFCG